MTLLLCGSCIPILFPKPLFSRDLLRKAYAMGKQCSVVVQVSTFGRRRRARPGQPGTTAGPRRPARTLPGPAWIPQPRSAPGPRWRAARTRRPRCLWRRRAPARFGAAVPSPSPHGSWAAAPGLCPPALGRWHPRSTLAGQARARAEGAPDEACASAPRSPRRLPGEPGARRL